MKDAVLSQAELQTSKVRQKCDLLICSTDSYLKEAMMTIGQIRRLGFLGLFESHLLLAEARPAVKDVAVLNRDGPGTWSSELRAGLQQLEKPYVFLWLDDLTPTHVEPLGRTADLIAAFMDRRGDYLRLNPTPAGHGRLMLEARVREILPGEIYRTSTVLAIWRRAVLLELLDRAETAWQFELLGSARSDKYAGFYASERCLIRYVNVVVKGRVDPRAEASLRQFGVVTEEITRPRMTSNELNSLRMREIRSKLLEILPWQVRRPVRSLFATDLRRSE